MGSRCARWRAGSPSCGACVKRRPPRRAARGDKPWPSGGWNATPWRTIAGRQRLPRSRRDDAVDPRGVRRCCLLSVAYGNLEPLPLAAKTRRRRPLRTTVARSSAPREILFGLRHRATTSPCAGALAAMPRQPHHHDAIEHHTVINTCEQLARALGCRSPTCRWTGTASSTRRHRAPSPPRGALW